MFYEGLERAQKGRNRFNKCVGVCAWGRVESKTFSEVKTFPVFSIKKG